MDKDFFSRIGYWSISAGFVVGILLVLAFFAYDESANTWHQLSYSALSPPLDKATELLGYDEHSETVYIKGESQHIYACRANPNNSICLPLDQNSQAQVRNDSDCAFKIYPTPQPPGVVVSRIESHPCVPETIMQANHVILEDGSIWQWITGTSEGGEGIRRFFTIGGGLIGAILGFLIGIVLHIRKRQAVSKRG